MQGGEQLLVYFFLPITTEIQACSLRLFNRPLEAPQMLLQTCSLTRWRTMLSSWSWIGISLCNAWNVWLKASELKNWATFQVFLLLYFGSDRCNLALAWTSIQSMLLKQSRNTIGNINILFALINHRGNIDPCSLADIFQLVHCFAIWLATCRKQEQLTEFSCSCLTLKVFLVLFHLVVSAGQKDSVI